MRRLEAVHIVTLFCTQSSADMQTFWACFHEKKGLLRVKCLLCVALLVLSSANKPSPLQQSRSNTVRLWDSLCSRGCPACPKRVFPCSSLSLLPPLLPQKPLGAHTPVPATFHSLLGGDFCRFSNPSPVRHVCASCVCLQLKESSIPINFGTICASQ